MDAPAGPSNGSGRKCLVCGTTTKSVHLGVDACRACTVFYRRTRGRKVYACRSNTRNCEINAEGGLDCKRCRFDRFQRILDESGAKEMMKPSLSQPRQPSPVVSPSHDANHSPSLEQMQLTPSSSSATSPASSNTRKERVLLEKCKLYYNLMSAMRRSCELSSRPNAPHPLEMTEEECPIYPATFAALNAATKIALAAVLEFAKGMFPEFSQLSREERWNLAVRFFYRYQGFDSCYRAHKKFPDDIIKSFGSYTCYYDHDCIENFFDDCPGIDRTNLEEVKKFMRDSLDQLTPPGRTAISRANPNNEEFHAVLVLLFWFTDGAAVRDEIVQLAEKYRSEVLQELHAYYREEVGLNDYATRVGELFMMIMHFEKNTDIKEHFEICRMLGIVNDNTFMYQLQKE